MSDNMAAVFFVAVFIARGAWSEWLDHCRWRAQAELEFQRAQNSPGAGG